MEQCDWVFPSYVSDHCHEDANWVIRGKRGQVGRLLACDNHLASLLEVHKVQACTIERIAYTCSICRKTFPAGKWLGECPECTSS